MFHNMYVYIVWILMSFVISEVTMKIELCAFSGFKIYPGHGRTMVKADGKTYKFLSAKTQRSHDLKRNPRKITWTVLYRKAHYLLCIVITDLKV